MPHALHVPCHGGGPLCQEMGHACRGAATCRATPPCRPRDAGLPGGNGGDGATLELHVGRIDDKIQLVVRVPCWCGFVGRPAVHAKASILPLPSNLFLHSAVLTGPLLCSACSASQMAAMEAQARWEECWVPPLGDTVFNTCASSHALIQQLACADNQWQGH